MDDKKFVVFCIGQEEYAVPISQAKEIIIYTAPTKIPSNMEGMLGVINLRGKILPLIDLGKKLNIESKKEINEQKIIIIENTDRAFGTIVDDVEEVMKIPEGNTHKISDALFKESKYIIGIARIDNRLIIIIDLNLLGEEVFK